MSNGEVYLAIARKFARKWLRLNVVAGQYAAWGLSCAGTLGLVAHLVSAATDFDLSPWSIAGLGFFVPFGPVLALAATHGRRRKHLQNLKELKDADLMSKSEFKYEKALIQAWYSSLKYPGRLGESDDQGQAPDDD